MAALMRGTGRNVACELNKERVKVLEETVKRSGAPNVEVSHIDFLKIDSKSPLYSKVRAILSDPSCSGSGTSTNHLDYLLPSYDTVPSVERVVYSACSIHQKENEDVIQTILPVAQSLNFQLEAPFPQWPRRGLPVFDGAEHLLRTDPADGMEGFFIALFVRKHSQNYQEELKCERYSSSVDCSSKTREIKVSNFTNRESVHCISKTRERKVWNFTNRKSASRNLPRKIHQSLAKIFFRMYPYVKWPRAISFLCMIKSRKFKRKQHYEMRYDC